MWDWLGILLTLYLVMMIQMEQMVMVDCTVLILEEEEDDKEIGYLRGNKNEAYIRNDKE